MWCSDAVQLSERSNDIAERVVKYQLQWKSGLKSDTFLLGQPPGKKIKSMSCAYDCIVSTSMLGLC